MSVPHNRTTYHDPYANLASAIIESGERCHDSGFLESAWCEALREMCLLDDQMYGGRGLHVDTGRRITPGIQQALIQG